MNTIDDSTALGLGMLTFVLIVVLYVWTALALSAVFRKSGEQPWKAWVPILNHGRAAAAGRLLGLALSCSSCCRSSAPSLVWVAADRRVLSHQRRVRPRGRHDGARRPPAAGVGVDPRLRARALARDGAHRARCRRAGVRGARPLPMSTTPPPTSHGPLHRRTRHPSRFRRRTVDPAPSGTAAAAGIRLDSAAGAPGRGRAHRHPIPCVASTEQASFDAPPPPVAGRSAFEPQPDAMPAGGADSTSGP